MESLNHLAFGSCSSVRGVVLGHSAEVETAFADASQSLARFASERELIVLMKASTDRIPAYFPKPLVQRLATGAAEITGTIFNNPRIAGCTRIALELGRRNR